MACLKSVSRSASGALSPESPYIAAGPVAGAVHLSFSTSDLLEIFKLDFQSDDKELPLVGQSASSERFNRQEQKQFGGIWSWPDFRWSPRRDTWCLEPFCYDMVTKSSVDPLLTELSRHKVPVRGLEFNLFAPHLLASGANDGEICILDLSSPAKPSHFPPFKWSGMREGQASYIGFCTRFK